MNRKKIIICLCLTIMVTMVYWQIQDHEFLNYDDDVYVTDNQHVKTGLNRENIIWAFTESHASNWHPVTWLSHMVDCELYGLNPKGHHLTNLFFHAVNSILLFLVLSRMTGAFWKSAVVATLFAIHPLHVESVAWVSERKDVLSMFFMMLTIWAYIRYVENSSTKRYLLIALFFALGLMSKPMLVTLPFVLLLLDFWPLERFKSAQTKGLNKTRRKKIRLNNKSIIREKIPLLLLAFGSSILTFMAQQGAGSVLPVDVFSIQTRIINALVSYLEYLGKIVWPTDLSILYPHPGDTILVWKGILAAVILIGFSIFVIRLASRKSYLAVGWFWYLGTLVPVIGIVQVGVQSMADRYTYIPLIGIFIIVVWGLPDLLNKFPHKEKIFAALGTIVVPLLMVATWAQVQHWKNSITIYNHAIDSVKIYNSNFAGIHYNLGNALGKKNEPEKAIKNYEIAIRLNPEHYRAHYNIGNSFIKKYLFEKAVIHYEIVIKLNPGYYRAHNNLGAALDGLGKLDKAIIHFKNALKINPNHSRAQRNLKMALSLTE